MHVKRLYRPSVREALAAAKAELGPDALVLSTELVPAPGWRGWLGHRLVRLTAAAERPVSESRTTVADGRQSDAPRAGVGTPTVAPRTTVSEAARVTAASEPARFSTKPTGPRAGVIARLVASGLDPALAQAIADRLTDGECRGRSDAALARAVAAELGGVVAGDEAFARYEVFV